MRGELSYADLHIHLLPGLDDGPEDLDGSLDLLRACWRGGTRYFCATPHYSSGDESWEVSEAKRRLAELKARAAEEGLEVDVRLGAEVAIHPELLDGQYIERLPTLGGSRYILLEAPPIVLPPNLPRFLYRFRETGLIPVLAHPERTEALVRDPGRMREITAAGCLIQVTAGSLVGEWGRKVRKTAHTFLREGWVHVVATDGHGRPARLCDLSVAEKEAASVMKDAARARTLVWDTPLRLMGGERQTSLPDGD
ncbi:MAG: tyrosine-protein phosphatase [Planctomycetota bacterium]|jgi:protein-tyrosine phosphatase